MKFQLKNVVLMASIAVLTTHSANAQSNDKGANVRNPNQLRLPNGNNRSRDNDNSQHETERKQNRSSNQVALYPHVFRSIDGGNNNLENPSWGQAEINFTRLVAADYADGESTLAGTSRPSPRLISNIVHATRAGEIIEAPAVSDMLWQWGQFLDHDITLTPEVDPEESADINIPQGDIWFDPGVTGEQVIHFGRSSYSNDDSNVRQQINAISAYIDASNVYGSDAERAAELRTNDGTGKLKTSTGDLLPFNTAGLANAPANTENFFLAGDFRANEQAALISMHTLFVREHNRLADKMQAKQPELAGEDIYQRVRALVAAEMQVITYQEFLPTLLGRNFPRYNGYKPNVNASISNEFATAAYRFGHTMLSPELLRLDAEGNEVANGHLSLQNAFFVPNEIINHDIDSLLRGLSQGKAQKIDRKIVDDVRNLLFGAPGAGGLDLASLNIQRGRDHGLGSYVETRKAMGLRAVNSFSDISSDSEVQHALEEAYGSVEQIDLWVGGLSETAKRGSLVGETMSAILVDQFSRLRDGDRFWYSNYLPRDLVKWADQQTLAKIIKRNTAIGEEMSDNVFVLETAVNKREPRFKVDDRRRQ